MFRLVKITPNIMRFLKENVVNYFPVTFWNTLNYSNAPDMNFGRFVVRCKNMGLNKCDISVFESISGGKETITFEDVRRW